VQLPYLVVVVGVDQALLEEPHHLEALVVQEQLPQMEQRELNLLEAVVEQALARLLALALLVKSSSLFSQRKE
jgi:hypothetical protein